MTIFDYILLTFSFVSFVVLLIALSSVPEYLIGIPKVQRQIRNRFVWIVVPLFIVAYRVWG